MLSTSITLLDKLRQPRHDAAWERFLRLYAPLLLHWATLQGLRETDAEDLVQTILVKLLHLLPTYQRREGQSFRGWLFTICRNECRDFRTRRATKALPGNNGLIEVAAPPVVDLDESEYRRQLVRRALELVRPDFWGKTWEAFEQFVLHERSAAEVARALGITPNAVYLARHRILARIREELAELLD